MQEFMLYKCELGHNAEEATKCICYSKGDGAVDHNALNKWFKKFCLGCKNLNDQARLCWPKILDYEPSRQIWWVALWEYQASSASQFSMAWHLHNLLPNWASYYQNIAKLETHPSITVVMINTARFQTENRWRRFFSLFCLLNILLSYDIQHF